MEAAKRKDWDMSGKLEYDDDIRELHAYCDGEDTLECGACEHWNACPHCGMEGICELMDEWTAWDAECECE